MTTDAPVLRHEAWHEAETAHHAQRLLALWPFAWSVTVIDETDYWHRAEQTQRESTLQITVRLQDVMDQRG